MPATEIPPAKRSAPGSIVGRALIIAMVVGTLLVLINHGDHIENEPICDHFYAKCVLSYLTPFVVSVLSAIIAAREYRKRARK